MIIGIDARHALNNKRGHGRYLKGLLLSLLDIDACNRYLLYTDTSDSASLFAGYDNAHLQVLKPRSYVAWEQVALPSRATSDGVDLLFLSNHTAPWFCTPPCVLTVHDVLFMNPASLRQPFHQTLGRWYKRLFTTRAAGYAKQILTVSEYSKRRIVEELHIAPENIHVTYEGFEPVFHRIETNGGPVLSRFNLHPKQYVLCLGAQDPRKNTVNTLVAFKKLRSKELPYLSLVVCGMNAKQLQSMLPRRDFDLLENVVTAGFVSDDDLAELYNHAAVFVYASLGEGFGIPALEAMACGTPVVAANVTSLPEIVGDAGLLVDPRSTEEIAQALQLLMNADSLRLELIRRGAIQCQKFSWPEVARKTLSTFEYVARYRTSCQQ
ncbi:MAG: glycosyltransferase family 4 protein [Acidobacteria bacterium]|nr:glycosyltransferase family 4 protein [Acidobacteriota bacterium]